MITIETMSRARPSCPGMPEMDVQRAGRNASRSELIQSFKRAPSGCSNHQLCQLAGIVSERLLNSRQPLNRHKAGNKPRLATAGQAIAEQRRYFLLRFVEENLRCNCHWTSATFKGAPNSVTPTRVVAAA